MTFAGEWQAISARIDGICRSTQIFAQFRAINTADCYGISKQLHHECSETLRALEQLISAPGSSPPQSVHDAIRAFLDDRRGNIVLSADTGTFQAEAAAVFLMGLQSQISYLLADAEEQVRSQTELAFLHLQRLLAVDRECRARWTQEFQDSGEIGCEKLGAAHLLWHGIYAFKANSEGARTDLIFAEPLDPRAAVRGIHGLVLTEWKVADPTTAERRFVEAREQAQLYTIGPLLGVELTGYRYAVVVSENQLPKGLIPDDIRTGDVVYRHINVAIDPLPPSRRARQHS